MTSCPGSITISRSIHVATNNLRTSPFLKGPKHLSAQNNTISHHLTSRTFSTTAMSWMDSWSRPSKHAVTPPPLYLTVGDTVPYCHTCGRVISERRKTQNANIIKYCSTRCRNNKPGPTDRKIEATFAALLNGASLESLKESAGADVVKDLGETKEKDKDPFGGKGEKGEKKHKKKASKSTKGETRIILDCSTVEEVVFQREKDPQKVYGRRKNRKARFVVEKPEDWRSVDMVEKPVGSHGGYSAVPFQQEEQRHQQQQHQQQDYPSDSSPLSSSDDDDEDSHQGGVVLEPTAHPDPNLIPDSLPDSIEFNSYGYGSGKIRPPQAQNDVNGSVGGEKGWAERSEETDDMRRKRREGQKRAEEREAVRKAARRACAFGVVVEGESERRKCEAVMKGVVVEASFAKGEWGIRWRERV